MLGADIHVGRPPAPILPPPLTGWAIVELLGHRQERGFLSVQQIGPEATGPILLRLDTPTYDEAANETGHATIYIGPAAIYVITPTSEGEVRDFVRPWVQCREVVPGDSVPIERCALRKGHDGEHDADDGIPF